MALYKYCWKSVEVIFFFFFNIRVFSSNFDETCKSRYLLCTHYIPIYVDKTFWLHIIVQQIDTKKHHEQL